MDFLFVQFHSTIKHRELLLDLKEKIYCSAPEELDFNEMSQYIKQVIETYKG